MSKMSLHREDLVDWLDRKKREPGVTLRDEAIIEWLRELADLEPPTVANGQQVLGID